MGNGGRYNRAVIKPSEIWVCVCRGCKHKVARLNTTVSAPLCMFHVMHYPHTPLQQDAYRLLSTQTCFQLQHMRSQDLRYSKMCLYDKYSWATNVALCVEWCSVLSKRVVCKFMDTVKTPHSFQLCGNSTFSVLLSSQIATVLGYTACIWKPLKIVSKHEKEINHYILHVINSL